MAQEPVTFGANGYTAITNVGLAAKPRRALLGPENVGLAAKPRRALLGPAQSDDEQFMLYKLGGADQALVDLTKIVPTVAGSDGTPDVDAAVNLLSFHFAKDVAANAGKNMRATLRFDLGKDNASTSLLEPLFWSVAAGLDLYEHAIKGTNETDPKKMNQNFADNFKRRPIEIPGGLGQLRFEVIVHEEPKWWQQILDFGKSDAARRLVSSFGFPGIAFDAMRLVDEMVSRFTDAAAKPLIRSRPLTLAFSAYARDQFTGGDIRTLIGCVGSGNYVLTRISDIPVFLKAPPIYLGTTGMLVVQKDWNEQGLKFDYAADPYRNITYAVLNIRTFERKIQVA